MKIMGTALLVVAAFAASAASAGANLLINGNFAKDAPASGCVAGTTTLPGWSVTTGNIDIDSNTPGCSTIPPAKGKYWIDLTGSFGAGAGTINQTVKTRAGHQYLLTFHFGGNPDWQSTCQFSGYPNDGPTKSMVVLISGTVPVEANYSIDTSGLSCSDAGWVTEGLLFTATSDQTSIAFESLNVTGVYGPLLSGVSLVHVHGLCDRNDKQE